MKSVITVLFSLSSLSFQSQSFKACFIKTATSVTLVPHFDVVLCYPFFGGGGGEGVLFSLRFSMVRILRPRQKYRLYSIDDKLSSFVLSGVY